MRNLNLFLFIVSSFFVGAASASECNRPRYKSSRDADSAVRSCLARIAREADEDDDSDEIDVAILREVKSAAKDQSLECEEKEQRLVELYVTACGGSDKKFRKVPNKERYRCRLTDSMYVYIFSSGDSFNRVAVIGTEDGQPDVKANCEK